MPPASCQPKFMLAKFGMALSCAPAPPEMPTAMRAINAALQRYEVLNIPCSLGRVLIEFSGAVLPHRAPAANVGSVSETGADSRLNQEHGFLAEARLISVADRVRLARTVAAVRCDHHQFAAFFGDDHAGGIAVLAVNIEHGKTIGKARRDFIGQKAPPIGFAYAARSTDVPAEKELELHHRPRAGR